MTMTNENEIKRTKCGEGVEFNPERHEYKKNGVINPSVSKIIRQVFGYKYGAVSPEVLARACERKRGTLGSRGVSQVRHYRYQRRIFRVKERS